MFLLLPLCLLLRHPFVFAVAVVAVFVLIFPLFLLLFFLVRLHHLQPVLVFVFATFFAFTRCAGPCQGQFPPPQLNQPAPSFLMLAQERLKGKPDIFDTARSGDIVTLDDYFLADPACVNQKGGG